MMASGDQPKERDRRAGHAGTRCCVGCGVRVERGQVRSELLRIVLAPREDGQLDTLVDLRGTAVGRGLWVHARQRCLEDAVRRGFARAAKARVVADTAVLAARIVTQAEIRVEALLASAKRAGRLEIGTDAVREATRKGQVALLIVATDAAAAAKIAEVETAQRDGRAVAWGVKSQLGATVGRGEVGVMAVGDDGFAVAIRHAIGLTETFRSAKSTN